MSLAPGTRIGPYEIVAQLGEGGMGQVYRARDTKLGRDVALKVLPDVFSKDPGRLARFRREAQVLASLNHPNIGAIYGFEDAPPAPGQPATSALVLELVEGPTLADRVAAGPMPLTDALAIASQIVAALSAAHERGIIHRDLKPANIVLNAAGGPTSTRASEGRAKVLDFGLAKAFAPEGASAASSGSADAAQSPTMTSPAMTEMGLILGTAAYMAPEQARGRAVDKRADIWAFGCVLFEVLTGRRAFPGEGVTDTLASILRGDPEWSALPATTPPSIRRLLRRCLAKDPARRLSDISDAQLEIDDALAPADPSSQLPLETAPRRSLLPWLVAAAVGLVALGLAAVAVTHFRESPPAVLTYRLGITPPDGTVFSEAFGPTPVVSPDGRSVVFVARRLAGGSRTLWVRSLDDVTARELAGTEEAGAMFWSPDSRSIAFFTSSQLKRVEAAGGPVSRICSVQIVGGGIWTSDGTIILGGTHGLSRVPAAGGEPQPLTKVAAGENAHVLPSFLPDGRRFLFNAIPSSKIFLASLDDPTTVTEITTRPPAYYAFGFLLYTEEGRLIAQPFDAARAMLVGDPVTLADGLPGLLMPPAATALAFQTGASTTSGLPVWVGRDGREGERVAGIGTARHPRLSPDGQRLAIVIDDDLWVSDLRGRPAIRLTFDGQASPKYSPLWSSDGRRLIYEGDGLSSVAADGSDGTPTRVSPPQGHFHPYAYTAGGVITAQLDSPVSGDIMLLESPTAAPKPVLNTPAAEGLGGLSLSPDGRWLAYAANPTDRQEIWVRPYPGPGAPVRVSPNGGAEPLWAPNGKELYYREGQSVMAVTVQAGSELQFGTPVRIIEGGYASGGQPMSYDIAPDGRFLLLKLGDGGSAQRPIMVIVNWMEEVRRRAAGQ